MLCLSLLYFTSLFIRTAVKGTHLDAIRLAVCLHVSIDMHLFKEIF